MPRVGQAVYDPFLGSGTSLIAAEATGRICFGLELSPAYVDVIIQRWQAWSCPFSCNSSCSEPWE